MNDCTIHTNTEGRQSRLKEHRNLAMMFIERNRFTVTVPVCNEDNFLKVRLSMIILPH